ncbi:MAG: hypothetical protein H8E36_08390 [Rhodospirillaceae bacterium]|nr:hypothetical protein [Rhodospirillaceae bacterium]MBL6942536.1 hypothetical protein [Rhodospirillales bacterium]
MMAQTPDIDELARRYLDLWQRHLGDLAADDELAATLAKTMELMNGSATAFANMAQQTATQPGETDHGGGQKKPSGSASPGPAPGHSDDDLDKLAGRIEELERRIAELESAPGGTGKRPKGRSSRSKT